MKLFDYLNDMSLRKKIMILFAIVGIVPLVVTFFVSYDEIRKLAVDGQSYAENENYEQMLVTLSKKFYHLEELTSMIIVNKDLNGILSKKPEELKIPEQLTIFNNIVAFSQIMESNSEFDRIIYYINDDFIVAGDDTMFRRLGDVQEMPWVKSVYANNGRSAWFVREETGSAPGKYLAVGRLLWNPTNLSEPSGIVTLNIDTNQIRQSLTKSNPQQLIYIATAAGELIASTGDAEYEEMRLPKPIDSAGAFESVTIGKGSYLARGQRIGNTNLFLISVLSNKAATEALKNIRTQMLSTYAIISLIILIVIFPVAKSITRRIFLLMNKMSQVRQGRLNELDISPSKDEVGQLISSYNYMIGSLQELLAEQFKLGQEKNGAELKALQSQINPHFLYNTLDMLNWMAQKGERENIQQVVYALSGYYRLILNKGEDFVTVRDEVRLSAIYMDIQMKRFRNRITIDFDVDEEAMDCLIPKITLQPLVENAIIHGISEKEGGTGVIRISGGLSKGRLLLEVKDDGVGYRRDVPDRHTHKGSGYGVKNIEKRLELYFGQPASLRFSNLDEGGTCVTIDVPAVRRESD
ncbi:sensor histidine kinase [Paenibacillus harenae]|uniref:Two-component system sensor histidine kinase YesM n=1 Tax=Paenibacillus harenae TaxID=306543 RepID=A0ABT9TYT2_PAEHA|nr:sensor histidine kinase [Paenibacillus harenae]MDQ0112167.1 two-component system sensor histidine kinase YesM [Paenibacillus harenae]